MADEAPSVVDMSDEEFVAYVQEARFEALKAASEAAVVQLRRREIGFDDISLVLERVRVMLEECEARILRVEQEVAALGDAQ